VIKPVGALAAFLHEEVLAEIGHAPTHDGVLRTIVQAGHTCASGTRTSQGSREAMTGQPSGISYLICGSDLGKKYTIPHRITGLDS
jgi:hypothetical protein